MHTSSYNYYLVFCLPTGITTWKLLLYNVGARIILHNEIIPKCSKGFTQHNIVLVWWASWWVQRYLSDSCLPEWWSSWGSRHRLKAHINYITMHGHKKKRGNKKSGIKSTYYNYIKLVPSTSKIIAAAANNDASLFREHSFIGNWYWQYNHAHNEIERIKWFYCYTEWSVAHQLVAWVDICYTNGQFSTPAPVHLTFDPTAQCPISKTV